MQINRIQSLDLLRGFAILLMIIYHFTFDLNYFGFLHLNLNYDTFWKSFRYIIILMFLFSFSYSLGINTSKISYKKVLKRVIILLTSSMIITISTYFIFPNSWIYFGILHFILLSYIVSLIFIRLNPIVLFSLSIALYIFYLFGFLDVSYIYNYLKDPLYLPKHTEDLVRFFPWFSVVLFGIAVSKYKILEKITIKKEFKLLKLMGQNSLLIYMIHQPILFSFVYLLSYFLKSNT